MRENFNYIDWAQGRIAEVDRLGDLAEFSRCTSNSLFVRQLNLYKKALSVIDKLKADF